MMIEEDNINDDDDDDEYLSLIVAKWNERLLFQECAAEWNNRNFQNKKRDTERGARTLDRAIKSRTLYQLS